MKYDEKQRRIMYEDQLKEYEKQGGRLNDYYKLKASRQKKWTLRNWLDIGFFGLAFIFGVYTFESVKHVYRFEARPEWSSVQGVVVASYVVRTRGAKGSLNECSHISYEYVANGQKYSGENIELYKYCVGISYAEDHPKNSKITVFYDPKNASNSALVVDSTLAKMKLKAAALWFALFVLLGILFFKKSDLS